MVFQGELHIRGINEGEEMVLKPGELVHPPITRDGVASR